MLIANFQEFDQIFLQACTVNKTFSNTELARIRELVQNIAIGDAKADRLLNNFVNAESKLPDLIVLHSYLMYQWIHPLLGKPGPWQDYCFKTGDKPSPNKAKIRSLTLIAENFRSAHNIGSLFRLADCAGVHRIILTGYTRTPANSADIAKTAMGTESLVPWTWFADSRLAIQSLKEEQVTCYGLETLQGAADITQTRWSLTDHNARAILLGNEHWGIAPTTLPYLDGFLTIPTQGYKNSLNVVQAASIVAYYLNF